MKTLFEKLGGTYTQQGDYYLPDIKLPEQPEYEIGVWGQRRRRHLKEHHRVLYYNMITKCTLYPHLAEVDQKAQDMFFRLVDEMAKREGITEQLKATDQMEWVRIMNDIQNRATEIVDAELIYQRAKQSKALTGGAVNLPISLIGCNPNIQDEDRINIYRKPN